MAKHDEKNRGGAAEASSRPVKPAAPGGAAAGQASIVSSIAICAILFGLVSWTFLPSIHNGFVNLDDPLFIYNNAHVRKGFSWAGCGWAFTNLTGGFWY